MKFILTNELIVENPSEEIETYVKENLILNNPQYELNERMGFYNGRTSKKVHFYRREGNNLVLPFGCVDDLCGTIVENDYITDFADVPTAHENKNEFELFEYQTEAVDKMKRAKNGILISPTGSGKTVMMMDLIGKIGQKTLWLCNTTELLDQARITYENMYNYKVGDIGVVKDGKIEIGNKITFALVQTLSRTDLKKDTFGCIIADEIQNAIKSLENTAMFSKCMEMFNARYKYGVTALYHRADGQEKRIGMLFGNIKHEVPRSAVAEKIMTATVVKVNTSVNESFEYLKTDGTLDFCQLQNYIATDKSRNSMIAKMIDDDASQGNSCIVLCDRISQIEDIKSKLGDYAVMVTGSMTSKKGKLEREQAIQDMRDKKKMCLIASVKLAAAGLDIKCLNRLYWVSLQKDEGIITQAVGRVLRSQKGKQSPIVYDFVDINIHYCKGAFNKRKRTYKKINCNFE